MGHVWVAEGKVMCEIASMKILKLRKLFWAHHLINQTLLTQFDLKLARQEN